MLVGSERAARDRPPAQPRLFAASPIPADVPLPSVEPARARPALNPSTPVQRLPLSTPSIHAVSTRHALGRRTKSLYGQIHAATSRHCDLGARSTAVAPSAATTNSHRLDARRG